MPTGPCRRDVRATAWRCPFRCSGSSAGAARPRAARCSSGPRPYRACTCPTTFNPGVASAVHNDRQQPQNERHQHRSRSLVLALTENERCGYRGRRVRVQRERSADARIDPVEPARRQHVSATMGVIVANAPRPCVALSSGRTTAGAVTAAATAPGPWVGRSSGRAPAAADVTATSDVAASATKRASRCMNLPVCSSSLGPPLPCGRVVGKAAALRLQTGCKSFQKRSAGERRGRGGVWNPWPLRRARRGPASGRRKQPARAPRRSHRPRRRGRLYGQAHRRAVERLASAHRRQDPAGARLPPAARAGGDRLGSESTRCSRPVAVAISSGSSRDSSSTPTAFGHTWKGGAGRAGGRRVRASRWRLSGRGSPSGAASRSPTCVRIVRAGRDRAAWKEARLAALEERIEADLALGRHPS